MFTVAGSVGLVEVLRPPWLNMPFLGFGRQFRRGKVLCERKPWLRDRGTNVVEMLIECFALERRERPAEIGQDRPLLGVETVHLEMLASDLDEGLLGRREGYVAEELFMELPREELHADFISFGWRRVVRSMSTLTEACTHHDG